MSVLTPSSPLTLSVDCGGGSIKSAVSGPDGTLVTPPVVSPVSYPFHPRDLVSLIAKLLADLECSVDRLTVGLPGMIRSGRIVHTPHYIRVGGPHTKVSQDLAVAWNNLNLARALTEATGLPVRVINDSELHGAALVSGHGLEVALTFGTGLGSSHFLNGQLQAHLEMSHAQFREGVTYDQYIGEHVRREIGDSAWSERILEVISALQPVYWWDSLFIGGGNAHNLTVAALEALTAMGTDITVVSNHVALTGGAKVWQLAAGPKP